MKFNSQICTTKEQSERLLALGLKKNTADCYYYALQRWTGNSYENTGELFLSPLWNIDDKGHFQYLNEVFGDEIGEEDTPYVLPAWSLHRLIELCGIERLPICFGKKGKVHIRVSHIHPTHDGRSGYNHYDSLIDCIEWLIKEGYFNKEYLEEK